VNLVRCGGKRIMDDENHIRCDDTISNGIQIGLYNYARKMGTGMQFGLINHVRSNRKGLRVLPIFNRKFE